MRKSRFLLVLLAVSMLTLVLGAGSALAGAEKTYEVTITNLTSGQPLTPALTATHKGSDGFFTVGKTASFGLQEIAENGNLGPMFDRASADRDFADVLIVTGDSGVPPIVPGETVTFEITSSSPHNFLSWASMLICTNDGFTGVDSLKLPNRVGELASSYAEGYDAGTELNTEQFDDIVPPCGPLTGQDSMGQGTGVSDGTLSEGGVIHHHAGILGLGDLDASINDWNNPVAKITVERTG